MSRRTRSQLASRRVVGPATYRKGDPVARRVRKARGLMQAAQLPKGKPHMSHHRRSFAVMATIAALAAVPATASATSLDSTTSSNQTVQAHVTKAQKAVKRLQRAVRAGNGTVVRRELKTARSQTVAAARVARRMTYAASTDPQEIAATQALTLAGTQYEQLTEAITALVDE